MLNLSDKFSDNFKKVIQQAAWICISSLQKTMTPLHLWLGILSTPKSSAYYLLQKNGLSKEKVAQVKTKFFARLPNPANFNPLNQLPLNPKDASETDHQDCRTQVFNLALDEDTVKILQHSAVIAVRSKHNYIGTEHLLSSMLELQIRPFIQEIQLFNVNLKTLEQDVKQTLSQEPKKTTDIIVKKKKTHPAEMLSTPALDYFTIDLTSKERQITLHPLIGRERELERLINILSRKQKNNPLLLGEPGVGKTAIIEGLAQRICENKVPDILINKRILNLDLNAIVAGTIYRGEFESRLKQIIEEIKSQDDVILFIDEIHNLIGAGSASGSLDAANILKPYLARGEISCIGATTFTEYKAHFENDPTLERRFQTIVVEEPKTEETMEMLKGLKSTLEKYHRVEITDEAIETAVNLSERFLANKYLPDKAIDLIDEAASRIKVKNIKDTCGRQIKDTKEQLKQLFREKETVVKEENFTAAVALKEQEEALYNKLISLRKKQEDEQETKIAVVTKEDITRLIAEIIKVPFLETTKINQQKLLNLEQILGKRVRGQGKVLKEIAKTLRRSEAGLSDPKRPLASLIFLGPSGVGKTETAKAIAEEIFGDKDSLIRINMSEFQESFNATKLIGAPAGYVGYRDSNQLADKVRAKPYSVVLFDEMEKAHPDVFNLLLQVLEDGYLMDSTGKHINFKNTVIVFTSNIGLERFNATQNLGFTVQVKNNHDREARVRQQFEEIRANILQELHNTFKVEFLNRIDKILFFEPLTLNALKEIVELNIEFLNKKLKDKTIQIELTQSATQLLAKLSFSPDEGARGVRKAIQEQIEEPLVEKILREEVKVGGKVMVEEKGKKIRLKI